MKGRENKLEDTLSKKFHVVSINMYQTDLKAKILEVASNHKFILQVKEGLLASSVKDKYEGYQIDEDNLILYKGRLYIPKNPKLRK